MKYTKASLCFLVQDNEVLLAEKQDKIGVGKLNGFGGKFEPEVDNDIFDTNTREVFEESNLRIKIAEKLGYVVFHNPSSDPGLARMAVSVFRASEFEGEIKETNEMKKIKWFKIEDLNYDEFLPADSHFVPLALEGKHFKGFFKYKFGKDGKTWELVEDKSWVKEINT